MTGEGRMHDDEVPVDEALVRRLLIEQHPRWADRPLRATALRGTVNATYRLGDDLLVRLPRTAAWAGDLARERTWLPRLRDAVTLRIPEPVAEGRPTGAYPLPWAVYRWLDGEPYAPERVASDVAVARDLARFVRSLRAVAVTADAPPTGRRPLPELDAATRAAVAEAADLVDAPAVLAAWDRALAAPAFHGPPVWIHTDLLPPNLLVRDGRLTAVVDFGAVGVGDPAADVIPAWTVLGAEGRAAYRDALEVDDATWERARGYALTQAALIAPYYRETNRPFSASARRTLARVVADVAGSGAA